MINNHQTNKDLKAFERRLTEIIACYQPQTKRWRIVLLVAVFITSVTTYQLLNDPQLKNLTLLESLHSHSLCTLSYICCIILIILGIHRKVAAPTIIVSRIRQVLENFNMSCDENGRLILKKTSANRLIL